MIHYYIIFISFISPSNYGVGIYQGDTKNCTLTKVNAYEPMRNTLKWQYSTFNVDSVAEYRTKEERDSAAFLYYLHYSKAYPLLTQN